MLIFAWFGASIHCICHLSGGVRVTSTLGASYSPHCSRRVTGNRFHQSQRLCALKSLSHQTAARVKEQTLLATASLRMRIHMACLRWQRKQRMLGRAENKCVFTHSKAALCYTCFGCCCYCFCCNKRVNASGQTRTHTYHEGCHLLQYESHIQPKLRDLIL